MITIGQSKSGKYGSTWLGEIDGNIKWHRGAVEEWTIEFNSMNLEKPSKIDYGCLQDIFLRHSTFPWDRSWLYVSSQLLVSILSNRKIDLLLFQRNFILLINMEQADEPILDRIQLFISKSCNIIKQGSTRS